MLEHHDHRAGEDVHHSSLDFLNWPTVFINATLWPWLNAMWQHAPTPTAVYMIVSAAFMLFQMSDKLGLLERLKRRPKLLDVPEDPEG
ncbi:MAG: hypothetical protein AAGL98_00235 [Planctomycetota bacterium]